MLCEDPCDTALVACLCVLACSDAEPMDTPVSDSTLLGSSGFGK